jgi:alpha-D-ribose 1-methylphosphonate 5-phosphate C-P lyase
VKTREMHAEQDYARMWVALYEDVVHAGEITKTSSYPAMVNGRHIFSPSPIPRWDLPKLHQAPFLALFGAGREKRIYAVPPYTDVVPLDFEDHPFSTENMDDRVCTRCGATGVYMDELIQDDGSRVYRCSDTAYCDAMVAARERGDRARIDALKAVAR